MLERYAQRCEELKVPVPVRVCSDRGLKDANGINHYQSTCGGRSATGLSKPFTAMFNKLGA
jgi:hypothetical protein